MKTSLKFLSVLFTCVLAMAFGNTCRAAVYIDYAIRTDDFYANVSGGENGDEELAWTLQYKLSSSGTYSGLLCYNNSDDYESGRWWHCSLDTIWTGKILDNADDLYILISGWENDDAPNCTNNGGDDDFASYENIDTNISGNSRNLWTGFYGACSSGTCSGYVKSGTTTDDDYRVEMAIWWNYSIPVNPSFSVSSAASSSFIINKTSDNNYRITDWDYQVSTNTAFTNVVKSGTEISSGSTTVTGLSPNTTYYIRIRGENEAGTGAYTSYQSQTTTKADQTITFGELPAKTFGDADFAPGATASSSLPVSYSGDNTSVATILSGKIHIIDVGTANITASQAGDDTYNPALPVSRQLTVNGRPGLWTGQASSNWQEALNWQDGSIPDEADDVLIPDASTTSNDPDIDDAYAVASFALEDGGLARFTDTDSAIIAKTGEISITGNGESNNGALIATGSSRIQLVAQSDDITLAGVRIVTDSGDVNFESQNGNVNVTGTTSIETTSSAITISGATAGSGTLNVSGGTLTYQRDADQAIFAGTCHHLAVSGSGIKTTGGALSVNGDLTIDSGVTLTIANGDGTDLTVQGNLNNSGTLTCADDSEVVFSGPLTSSLSGSGAWNFKSLTLNKDASDDILDINTGSDVTVATALTITRGSVDLSGWTHDLLLGGALDIGADGRWINHGNNAYCIRFYGNACTLNDQSSNGPQNPGHIRVDDL